MNKKVFLLTAFSLVACTPDPNVTIRIDCGDYNDKGLQATLNSKVVGDCPIDMMVHAGDVTVTARKDNEDASYLYGEAKMMLAENSMKRIKLDIQPVYTEEYYYRKTSDLGGMHLYLENFPTGKYHVEVKKKIEGLVYQSADSEELLGEYIATYPQGEYIQKAQSKLSEMVSLRIKAEEEEKKRRQHEMQLEIKRKAEERVAKFLKAGFKENDDGTVTEVKTGVIWYRCQYPKKWQGSECKGEELIYTYSGFIDFFKGDVTEIKYQKVNGNDDWIVIDGPAISLICNKENSDIMALIFPDYKYNKCFSENRGGIFSARSDYQYYSSSKGASAEKYFIMLMRIPAAVKNSILEKERAVQIKDGYQLFDQYFIDNKSGLMWTRCPAGYPFNGRECVGRNNVKFNDAKSFAATSTVGGFKDWRVPSMAELKTLVTCKESGFAPDGYCKSSESNFLNTKLMPIYLNTGVWSSEKNQYECNEWGHFTCAKQLYQGQVSDSNVVNSGYVFFVRNSK